MDSDEDCPPELVSAALDVVNVPNSRSQEAMTMSSTTTTPSVQEQETQQEERSQSPSGQHAAGAVPVTIVTGFLGAGKTTLLNYILTQDHGRRIAVIENEVGDSMDIEELIARDGADGSMLEDNLFELKNGCICCTVKDDLVTTLEALLQRRSKFDYVIIETTGLANPGPVASVFWLDDALESALRLDGIITLVDAKNIRRQLQRGAPENTEGGDTRHSAAEQDGEEAGGEKKEEASRSGNEAAMQLAYADRVLINKTDLVSPDILEDVGAKVRAINAVAEVRCTERSTVDLAWILDTKCFSPDLALAVDPSLAAARSQSSGAKNTKDMAPVSRGVESEPGATRAEDMTMGGQGVTKGKSFNGHGAHNSHAHDGGECLECAAATFEGPGGQSCSVHDPAVTTHSVDILGSLELVRLERWLGELLWDAPPGGREIYRVKGVVSVEGRDERFVVQGVADLFEVAPVEVAGSAWRESEERHCKIVFIGRHLSKEELRRGVKSCMVEC